MKAVELFSNTQHATPYYPKQLWLYTDIQKVTYNKINLTQKILTRNAVSSRAVSGKQSRDVNILRETLQNY